jgi:hypothetical protein
MMAKATLSFSFDVLAMNFGTGRTVAENRNQEFWSIRSILRCMAITSCEAVEITRKTHRVGACECLT